MRFGVLKLSDVWFSVGLSDVRFSVLKLSDKRFSHSSYPMCGLVGLSDARFMSSSYPMCGLVCSSYPMWF